MLLIIYIIVIFNYACNSLKTKTSFTTIYSALSSYQSIYNNLNIPYKYIVPNDIISYPDTTTHGIKLGQVVSRIRNRGDYIGGGSSSNNNNNDNKNKLLELGLIISPSLQTKSINKANTININNDSSGSGSGGGNTNILFYGEFNNTLTALKIYKSIYHHCDVPAAYNTNQDSDSYPLHLQEFKLGRRLDNIRNQNAHAQLEKKYALKEIGML